MRQLVQSVRDGSLQVVEFPTPQPGPAEVLVATRRSLISSGTESAVRQLASSSLLQKAKARPDLVRQVIEKARSDGIANTVRAVRTRLDDDMPLGYSGMGVVVAVGEAVAGIRPGDRVATASAGHGDYQLVPGLLVAPVPDNVSDADAAFATVGAIALHGLRQAELGVGASVAVIGLGLVGQLTTRLALASGLRVIGIDLRQDLVERASGQGVDAFVEAGADTTRAILELTQGLGVDAVLITAATPSSEPVSRATEVLRDRGRIVIVGDVGLDLDRRPFYEKELDLRFARSYGPGRYDRSYEEFGIDYPAGYVRWTEGRNLQAVLSLIARGRLVVSDLVSATYPLDAAEQAYSALKTTQGVLGVQFAFDSPAEAGAPEVPLQSPAPTPASRLSAGVIGAGNFARATLLPALAEAGWPTPTAIASASGLTAQTLAGRFQIPSVAGNARALIADSSISVLFVLSRHDSHAELTAAALSAGKHVFVEKPLALTEAELAVVRSAQQASGAVLWCGFNRRHSSSVAKAREALGSSGGPLVASYRVNAGWLPDSHWYKDRRQGGRLLGEVCHFVDTVSWIVGEQPHRVVVFGDGRGETILQEDLTVALQYPGGSTASISYSSGGSSRTPKERLEVLGRGHTVVIDDFSKLTIDGKQVPLKAEGKGHVANLQAFRSAVVTGTGFNHDMTASLGTTAAMLAAARSLSDGGVQQLL